LVCPAGHRPKWDWTAQFLVQPHGEIATDEIESILGVLYFRNGNRGVARLRGRAVCTTTAGTRASYAFAGRQDCIGKKSAAESGHGGHQGGIGGCERGSIISLTPRHIFRNAYARK